MSTMEFFARRRAALLARWFCLALGAGFGPATALAAEAAPGADVISQRTTAEGADIELRVTPLRDGDAPPSREREVLVEFEITDAASGSPLRGLLPAAWMDLQVSGTAVMACKEKVESSLGGMLAYRPMADLNAWFILTLNENSSISVLDPLIDLNVTKMRALVELDSPGADWVLTEDLKSLFVTLPLSDQVAVVDTVGWEVAKTIAAGPRPGRAVLQPDERYLWVGNDAGEEGEGGVTVIDTATGEVAARLRTGDGRHDIAVSEDDRFAAVTNSADGYVSIIDVQELRERKQIATGERPLSIDYSAHADAFYVADPLEGEIAAIDAESLEVRARMAVPPGLGLLRISPDGRWGFALNREHNLVHIFDTAVDQVVHEVEVGPEPDHVTFTELYAYVRARGSDKISLIGLSELGQVGTPPVVDVPGGQGLPGQGLPAMASPIAPTPEENSVLVANPDDEMVYYYMEGMGAPMGSFRNYRRRARAVIALDRGLNETAPGVYATTAQLPTHGQYDVAFLLDAPLIVHCFDIAVPPSPGYAEAAAADQPPHLEYLVDDREAPVGQDLNLRFKLTGAGEGPAVQALTVLAPGTWHKQTDARPLGEDLYEVPVSLPREGVYYVYVEVPSLGLTYKDLPHLILYGRKPS
jgi:DNA-binding beta-propeller fold protein YncE